MFTANLSFNLLEKYLDIVTRSGFVEVQGAKYKLTVRGKEFLKQYKSLHKRYNSARRLFETVATEREKLALMVEEQQE